MRKLYIKTYGCQMNEYDSDRMADVLAPLGYAKSDTIDDADMVILNTCHIREKASEKVYSELGRIREHKTARRNSTNPMLITVAGCVAQAEGDEILRRAPYVDIVVGPQTYHLLPELVTRSLREKGGVIALDFPANPKFDYLPEVTQTRGASAFLSIQEGCDKFCTFCVVPYTRGAEYSRSVEAIESEARTLVNHGAIEITLLGQNVNAWHGEGEGKTWTLGQLIRRIANIDGLQRIRYTTSHPRDMDDDLITAHGDTEKLMPFLHLPVQSGSDRILKAMNRRHTAAEYLDTIAKLRTSRPDIAFSSDFIIGFPGETDEDFEQTIALVKAVPFAQGYSFKYSPRPGTPASALPQLPEAIKDERLQRIQTLLNDQQQAFNKTTIGKTMPVLLERKGKLPGQLMGRTPHLHSVHIQNCPVPIGRMVNVTITESSGISVAGRINKAYDNENLATNSGATIA